MINIDTFKITNEVLKLIGEIDEFKGAWQALGTLAPDKLLSLRHVATIESVGSSTRIEGSKLSDRDVEKLLSHIEIGEFKSRDEQEVAGYAAVMELVFANWEEIPFSENHIKQLHRDLLQFSHKDERHRGSYKTLSNNVEAFDSEGNSLGVIFETTSPFATPAQMTELVDWYTQSLNEKKIHPLIAVAIFVVVFLAIHPFQDGNGRLSRVLTTLCLLKTGYIYAPYCSLESIVEQNKEAYYLALRGTQTTLQNDDPDWHSWVIFFLNSLQKQKAKLQEKVEREKILLGSLPELSLEILKIVKGHGRVTVGEASKLTNASRNTIKDHLKALVKLGHLEKHGAGRGTWYGMK